MDFPIFINKLIIGFKPIRYTPFFHWFLLINHSGFRFTDYHRYWDFWNSLNNGWNDMQYSHQFSKVWGKNAKIEKIVLSQEDFDVFQERLSEPPKFNQSLYDLLTRKSPWNDEE